MSDSLELLVRLRADEQSLKKSTENAFKNIKTDELGSKLGDLGFKKVTQKITNTYDKAGRELVKITENYVNSINQKFSTIKIGTIDEKGVFQQLKSTKNISDDYKKIANATKEVVQEHNRLNGITTATKNSLTGVTTIVKEYTNSQGEAVKITQEFDSQTNTLNKTLTETSRLIKETNSATIKRDLKGGGTLTTNVQEFSDGAKLITQIKQYTDEFGRAITETTKFNQKGEQLGATVRNVSQDMTKMNTTTKKVSSSLKDTSNSAQSLASRFTDIIKKVFTFYTATKPVQMFYQAITKAKEVLFEFDDALTQFRRVSGTTREELEGYVTQLGKMGELTGSTVTAMVQASTEFKKSGYSMEDSAKLASIAEMFRNVADEEISAADSAGFIIAQMKAFGDSADDAQHYIDGVNEVAKNFAVSSGDLANNLGNVSSVLGATGTTFDQTLGLMTAIVEKTRNASTASRGIKQISSRLTQTLDESSGTGKKLNAIYDRLNISLKDSQGQIRSTYDILSDLASQWGNLSKNEQEYIALTSAGANQVNNFLALMQNFDQAVKATNTSITSQGSASKENAIAMDSLAKQVQALKSAFEKLIVGDGNSGLRATVSLFLSFITGILNTINAVGGLNTILITTGVILRANIVKVLKESLLPLFTSLIGIIQKKLALVLSEFILEFNIAGGGIVGTIAGVKASITMLVPELVVLGAIIAGIAMTTNKTSQQSQKSLKTLQDELSSAQNEAEKLESKLDEVNEKIKTQERLQITDDKQLKLLEQERDVLKSQLAYQQAIAEAKKKEVVDKSQEKIYGKEASGWIPSNLEYLDDYWKGVWREDGSDVDYANKMFGAKKGAWQETADIYSKIIDIQNKLSDSTKLTGEETLKLKDRFLELIGTNKENITALQDYMKNLDESDPEYQKIQNRINGYTKVVNDLSVVLGITTGATSDLTEATDEYEDSTEETIASLEDMLKSFNFSETTLSGFNEAFTDVKQAIGEMNNEGSLSYDTFDKLMSLDAEYINLLFDEQGNLKATTEAQKELYKAKIDEMAISQARTFVDTATAYYNEHQTLKGYSAQIKETTNDTWDLIFASIGLLDRNGENTVAITKQVMTYKKWADSAKANVDAQSSLTTATETQTEALKSQQETLQKEVDKYSNAISYIERKIDEYVDKIQKQQKAEINSLTKEIERLNDLKDSSEDYYDTLLDNLEAEKDAYENNIDEQIDKLEEKKDAEKEYWQQRIDQLEKENDTLEENIKLQELQDALTKARSKKVKVYKEGQGFVYSEDTEAVASAQKALSEYQQQQAYKKKLEILKNYQTESENRYSRQVTALKNTKDAQARVYEQQKNDLTKAKNDQAKLYSDQITNLENLKTQTQEKYDAIINKWNEWKDKFKDATNVYNDEQSRLMILEQTGVDLESANWTDRISNLNSFVNTYKNKLAELSNAQEAYNNAQSQAVNNIYNDEVLNNMSTTSSLVDSLERLSSLNLLLSTTIEDRFRLINSMNQLGNDAGLLSRNNWKTYFASNSTGIMNGIFSHASGVAKVSGNEIAVTGENPNKEIVLGSKANGVLTSIDKGGGVVNARGTKTFAGIMNALGHRTNFGGANGSLINNNSNSSQSFVINGDIHLDGSNIKDVNSFKASLMSFKNDAMQRAYAR